MNDLTALRAAVLANPTDPTARLILSDAFEEAGDLPRAEWMRRLADGFSYGWKHVRTWELRGYRVELFDGGKKVAYELWHQGEGPVFWGDDFNPSPVFPLDSDRCIGALLSMLTARPGEWVREHGEWLSVLSGFLKSRTDPGDFLRF